MKYPLTVTITQAVKDSNGKNVVTRTTVYEEVNAGTFKWMEQKNAEHEVLLADFPLETTSAPSN